jgi:hypothetical protein
LHKIKHFFKLGAKHLIGDGRRTFFWTDWWIRDRPIKEMFPDLFNICVNPNLTVAAALDSGELNIVFRHALNPEGRRQWIELGTLIDSIVLSNSKDKVIWHLESSGKFSVQSLYSKLSQGASIAYHKDAWTAKVPLKIKIFAWQLILDRLPSSQQIATRHGPASGNCALCGQVEDVGHIFFSSPSQGLPGVPSDRSLTVTGTLETSHNSMPSYLALREGPVDSFGFSSSPNLGLIGTSAISLLLRKKLLTTPLM